MIEKPLAFLFGFGLFIFIGWIFLAPTGQARLQRSCQPVHWVGNVFVSMAALFGGPEGDVTPSATKRDLLRDGPDGASGNAVDAVTKTRRAFDEAAYSCRYTLWRLVYEEDYKTAVGKMQEEQAARERAARDKAAHEKVAREAAAKNLTSAAPAGATPLRNN